MIVQIQKKFSMLSASLADRWRIGEFGENLVDLVFDLYKTSLATLCNVTCMSLDQNKLDSFTDIRGARNSPHCNRTKSVTVQTKHLDSKPRWHSWIL